MFKALLPVSLRTLSITAVAGGGLALAQQPVELLDDIELAVASGADSSPRFLASDGQRTFFVHQSPTGAVLRVSDGTQAGTTVLLDQGITGAPDSTDGVVLPSGIAVFWLDRGDGVSAVFASDGTAAGTIELPVLADSFGFSSSLLPSIVKFAGEAWLVAPDPTSTTNQSWLYRTDGTVLGTSLATPQDGVRWEPVPGDTHLYFANREDPSSPYDTVLYAIDATGAPAQPFLSGGPFDQHRPVAWLPGEDVLLAVRTRPNEIPNGEWIAADGGVPEILVPNASLELALGVVAGGAAYLTTGGTAAFNSELYITDGTIQGTAPVTNTLGQAVTMLFDTELEPLGDGVVFVGLLDSTVGGFAVGFASADGAEPLMPLDFASGEWTFLSVSGFLSWNGQVYFGVGTPLFAELARTDGTPSGTVVLTDLDGGVLAPFAGDGVTSNGLLLSFSATPLDGFEPWLFDGQDLELLADYLPPKTASSDPRSVTELGPRVLFLPQTEEFGREPWITDGSQSGTEIVTDFVPGEGSSLTVPFELAFYGVPLAVVGDRALFDIDLGSGLGVASTDGSADATVELALPDDFALGLVFPPTSDRFVGDGEWLYFSATIAQVFAPDHLLRTNGFVVEDLGSAGIGEDLSSSNMFPANDSSGMDIFFAGVGLGTGTELFGHDGTVNGAVLIADINPGPAGSFPRRGERFGDRVVFTAADAVHGREVWVTDGTTAGTQLLAELQPGPASGAFALSGSALDGAYIVIGEAPGAGPVAVDPVTGAFQSLLDPLAPAGTAESTVDVFGAADGVAFLARDQGSATLDLWYAASPWSVAAKVQPVGADGAFEPDTGAIYDVGGGVALFGGRDNNGTEPWVLTGGQVWPLFDVNPGPSSSNPGSFGRAGERIVMAATTADFGRELFTTTVATVGANVVETVKAGCGDGAPGLTAQGRPTLGATVDLNLTGAAADAPLLWLAGPSFALPGLYEPCAPLLVDPFVFATGVTSAAGDAQFALTVPAIPAVLDLHTIVQAVVLDGSGPYLGSASPSDALELVVGP